MTQSFARSMGRLLLSFLCSRKLSFWPHVNVWARRRVCASLCVHALDLYAKVFLFVRLGQKHLKTLGFLVNQARLL